MLSKFAYISRERQKFSDEDLRGLMLHARKRNRALELTGLLLYDNGIFMQVLEGPDDAIQQMKQDILDDTRHDEMDIIYQSSRHPSREFANWRMELQILDNTRDDEQWQLDNRIELLLKQARPRSGASAELIDHYRSKKKAGHL